MPGAIFNHGWLPQNGQRPYPLADWATGKDASGTFQLPDDFLVDLVLPAPADSAVDPARILVLSVASYPSGVRIRIGYQPESGPAVAIAQAVVSREGHSEFRSYPLVGLGDFEQAAGLITVGRFDSIDLQPGGEFAFNLAGGQLVASCLVPTTRAVRSVRTRTGGAATAWFDGSLEILGGANIRVTPRVEGGTLVVRLDAVPGVNLAADCGCADAIGDPIRTINGLPPDADGNFDIAGNACISVDVGQGSITIKDACSEPCCGCAEAEALAGELETLKQWRVELTAFAERLAAQVTTTDQVVLGSRLGDRGCSV